MTIKKIRGALISVYHKENLEPLLHKLNQLNITLYSTGGTREYIEKLGFKAIAIESLTGYPSIFGGRVKTLHPAVMGGILYRREFENDGHEAEKYQIPQIDMVVVDLYPFEETRLQTSDEATIVEKIDIGGISLIRAAAKNFNDVLLVPAAEYYQEALNAIDWEEGTTTLEQRKRFAACGFAVSSRYDAAIQSWFSPSEENPRLRIAKDDSYPLRYGENPHQPAVFFGKLNDVLEPFHGKELSYNNLLDVDAAVNLAADIKEPMIAILKHNNPCGLASRPTLSEAWDCALAADPVSAFGGVIIANRTIEADCAEKMDKLFFEILIAPDFSDEAAAILQSKKNRILIKQKEFVLPPKTIRSVLNGFLEQERDNICVAPMNMQSVTIKQPSPEEFDDLAFANIIVKHTRSNAMILVKNKQLLGSGMGQPSRVDAMKQAIAKAQNFGFSLEGAVLASDAFFPFADNVQLAHEAGITAIIQPGGSIRDKDSIEYCNANNMAMVFSGKRHFRH
jgi:phosphoribosylaminoimidazolecarboxamide formyltransferase / IMP cyclohydrolase